MGFKSIKSKLLFLVSILVICSLLLISLLVTQRYSTSLYETMTAQAENLAHEVALEATDKILINDIVGLQKMLDHQMSSHSDISYLFILRDGLVLAHTFKKGFPEELVNANEAKGGNGIHIQKIVSTGNEHFMDIAWPIFDGKEGILRLGFSEKPYQQRIMRLWVQEILLALGILVLALFGALLFVRRITRPISSLVKATEEVDRGVSNVRVSIDGKDEIAKLAASFNQMIANSEEYTRKLEEQTMELERSQRQTETSCRIVQEIGSLRDLNKMGRLLIKKIGDILECDFLTLIISNSKRDAFFTISKNGVKNVRDSKSVQTTLSFLEGLTEVTFTGKTVLKPPIVPESLTSGIRKAMIPIKYENQSLGAVIIACPGECQCDGKDIQLAGMILTQAAGNISRAILREEEMYDLRVRMEDKAVFGGIIGKDPKMQVIYKLIEDVSPTDSSILIQGETGTGKEMVARAIHGQSPRKDNPFVVINCAAYPATILESELFGHEKGAFTGAIRQKAGRFEQANGGTVFLDEIGEIPPEGQIKLLRVLQTYKLKRVGGEKIINVDVRIIAATNKDLQKEVKNGNFREDLFYRINVIPISLPPLRERSNDIALLARHFLRRFAEKQGKDIRDFSPEAIRYLLDYSWPGNVRELENSIEYTTVLAKGARIEAADLPSTLTDAYSSSINKPPYETILENEKMLIEETLEKSNWNKKKTAKRLGISRTALYDKLKKYQIVKPAMH